MRLRRIDSCQGTRAFCIGTSLPIPINGGGICTADMRSMRQDLNVGQRSLIHRSCRMTLPRSLSRRYRAKSRTCAFDRFHERLLVVPRSDRSCDGRCAPSIDISPCAFNQRAPGKRVVAVGDAFDGLPTSKDTLRWEWRTFSPSLADLEAKIGLAIQIAARQSDEIYLLNSATPHSAKIRAAGLEVKRLVQVDPSGLELWSPAHRPQQLTRTELTPV